MRGFLGDIGCCKGSIGGLSWHLLTQIKMKGREMKTGLLATFLLLAVRDHRERKDNPKPAVASSR